LKAASLAVHKKKNLLLRPHSFSLRAVMQSELKEPVQDTNFAAKAVVEKSPHLSRVPNMEQI
jgi:hypothetical protein